MRTFTSPNRLLVVALAAACLSACSPTSPTTDGPAGPSTVTAAAPTSASATLTSQSTGAPAAVTPSTSTSSSPSPAATATAGGGSIYSPQQVATQARPSAAPRSVTPRPAGPAVKRATAKSATTKKAATAPAPKGPTTWGALNSAIARIPGYRTGTARWHVTGRYGHYGTTNLATGDIYISPTVPASLLYSVAAHEYAHAVVSRTYRYNVTVAGSSLARTYGGPSMAAQERAADCMAKRLGATWTHYTSCTSPTWRAAAGRLLAGQRL